MIARRASASQRSGEVSAHINDFQLQYSVTPADHEFRTRQVHLSDTSISNYQGSHATISVINTNDFDTVKAADDFTSYIPAVCLNVSNNDTQAPADTCSAGNMGALPTAVMSQDPGLVLDTLSIIDFKNNTHPFQDGSVFTIP